MAVSETEAVARRVVSLTAEVDQNKAAIVQESTVRANEIEALSLDIQTVSAETADNKSAITQERLARTDADDALAADITTVEANLGTKASASSVNALTSRVTQTENGIASNSNAITQVSSQVGDVSANGLFRIETTAAPSGSQSRVALVAEATSGEKTHSASLFIEAKSDGTNQFIATADRFVIASSSDGGATRDVPFVVDSGQVYMDNAFIKDLSVTNSKIGNVIQSHDFLSGENGRGWRIDKNGTAEFNNVIIRRQLSIATGTLYVDESSGADNNLIFTSYVETGVPVPGWLSPDRTYLATAGFDENSNARITGPTGNTQHTWWAFKTELIHRTYWNEGGKLTLSIRFEGNNVLRAQGDVRWRVYEVS